MTLPDHFVFTFKYNGFAKKLKTPVKITEKFVSSIGDIKLSEFANTGSTQPDEYLALWDTGATNSCITKKVVDDNSLKPAGEDKVASPYGGKEPKNFYLICFHLPNRIHVENVKAFEINDTEHLDVVIGMDIINLGDFSISNIDNKTSFSFRSPSIVEANFAKESDHALKGLPPPFPKTHQEMPCLCGSGKKYKKCHGT